MNTPEMDQIEVGTGPPLLLLHGFLGCAADMRPLMNGLAGLRRAIAFDLPGHGPSPEPPGTFDATVGSLLERMDRLGIQRFELAGYSMGGRLACGMLAAAPDRIQRLTLVAANPGLPPGERDARMRSDGALSQRIEADLPGTLEDWYALPLFGELSRHQDYGSMIKRRLAGRPAQLAAALRSLGCGCHTDYSSVVASTSTPLCYVAGAQDPKYVAIGRRLARQRPTHLVILDGAAHAVPTEQPGALIDALTAWHSS